MFARGNPAKRTHTSRAAHDTQFAFPMASEEKRRTLLALAPLLLHPPLIVQTSQLLYSTTGTTEVDLTSAGIAGLAALAVMDTDQPKKQSPRPQQGGHRITVQYLQELPDAEALWAFRYGSSKRIIINV